MRKPSASSLGPPSAIQELEQNEIESIGLLFCLNVDSHFHGTKIFVTSSETDGDFTVERTYGQTDAYVFVFLAPSRAK